MNKVQTDGAAEWRTIDQFAEMMQATPRQVRRWLDQGQLGCVALPRGRRISAAHIEAFIAERNRSALTTTARRKRKSGEKAGVA